MDIKPCPFCGPKHAHLVEDAATSVMCKLCGLVKWRDVWQSRPVEDAVQARIDGALGWLEKRERFESALLDELREILEGE